MTNAAKLGDIVRIRTSNGGEITGRLIGPGYLLEGCSWAIEPWRVTSCEVVARFYGSAAAV